MDDLEIHDGGLEDNLRTFLRMAGAYVRACSDTKTATLEVLHLIAQSAAVIVVSSGLIDARKFFLQSFEDELKGETS